MGVDREERRASLFRTMDGGGESESLRVCELPPFAVSHFFLT